MANHADEGDDPFARRERLNRRLARAELRASWLTLIVLVAWLVLLLEL